jgi:hypothetical protein
VVKANLDRLGLEAMIMSPQKFAAFLAAQAQKWPPVINSQPQQEAPMRRKPALFHPARHRRKGVAQRRTDQFHRSHNHKRNTARNNGIFDGGGAALTF